MHLSVLWWIDILLLVLINVLLVDIIYMFFGLIFIRLFIDLSYCQYVRRDLYAIYHS